MNSSIPPRCLAFAFVGFGLWLMAVAGCQKSPAEISFADQVAAVRAGTTNRILIEHAPLTDADLAQLAGAQGLCELLIDSEQSRITAAGIKQLGELENLSHLRLRGSGIDDAALAEIARLKSLEILNIPRAEIRSAGLAHLMELPQLVQFRCGSPHLDDAAMKTLAALPALKRLHLIDVPLTDAGLATLASSQQLQSLYIDGGQFSDAAVESLFKTRPDLHVHFNQAHHDRDPHAHAH